MRLNVGCFTTELEAALARAQAKAVGSVILPSPSKQAARSSGARSPPLCASERSVPFPFIGPFAVYLCFAFLVVCSAVKRSMAAVLSPLSNLGAYEISSSSLTSAIVPLSAASALVSSAISSSPFSFALAVLHARPLLPGQPLPQGVAALGLALPILQQR